VTERHEQTPEDEPVAAEPQAGPADETAGAEEAPAGSAEESARSSVEQDLNALVEEARNQRDEYLDLAQRTKADFDNYRKRMAAESAAAKVRGKLEVAGALIEAVDNLERAMSVEDIAIDTVLEGELPADAPASVQGLIVAYRDLNTTLRKAEVEAYDPAGENFDPTYHEALQAIPAEGVESGVVVEVMQRGYRSGETVIRPARVVVSQ
jgi:molecular chaperone GrpE